ncbi:hypothetical protein ABK040_003457 [Willaertia magna]
MGQKQDREEHHDNDKDTDNSRNNLLINESQNNNTIFTNKTNRNSIPYNNNNYIYNNAKKLKHLSCVLNPLSQEEKEEAKHRKLKRLELEELKKNQQIQVESRLLQKSKEFKELLKRKRSLINEFKVNAAQIKQSKLNLRKVRNEETKSHYSYIGASNPEDEPNRLMAVYSYKILDTNPNEQLDDIVDICMKLFDVPASLISIIDEYRVWFKSVKGFGGEDACRNLSFCSYCIRGSEMLLVNDATKDERFKNNPYVAEDPYLRFYAGYPLITKDGYRLGVLCLLDYKPRNDFDKEKERMFQKLAFMVVRELEMFRDYDTALQNEKFQRSIVEFEKQIHNTVSIQDKIELATLFISENLEVDFVELFQVENDCKDYKLSGSFHWGEEEESTILDDNMFKFIVNGFDQIIKINSLELDNSGIEISENGKRVGVKSFLSCKVFSDETLRGFITVCKKTARIWVKEEIDFLEQLSNSLAKMIDREIAKAKIKEEQLKSEKLLANILPTTICERLKENNQEIIADKVRNATVMFCDIVGFTTLTKNQKCPSATVEFLNYVFSEFDNIIEKHNVEKIKTIGDCLMVSSGLLGQEEDHAICMIEFALDILSFIQSDIVQNKYSINVRIGISTGEVCAGCIGKKKNTYDIWGDAVNLASRMESHGKPGRIHTTIKTLSHLTQYQLQTYDIEERGTIKVKGVGKMETFFINGKVL